MIKNKILKVQKNKVVQYYVVMSSYSSGEEALREG